MGHKERTDSQPAYLLSLLIHILRTDSQPAYFLSLLIHILLINIMLL